MNKAIRSQACRILAGAGVMSMTPYHVDPGLKIDITAHGLDVRGNLVVSCLANEVLYFEDMDVRIDAILKAPEYAVDVISASMHGIGEIEWMEFVGPFRMGHVHLDRVYMHQCARPTAFDVVDLVPQALDLPEVCIDTLGAREVVGEFTEQQLRGLIDAACSETLHRSSALISELNGRVSRWDATHVVDVSEFGITLFHTSRCGLISAFIAFEQPANTLDELRERLSRVVAISVS
ncbi:hypothetical protein HW450_08150 [Corynebacterium hindlerae]|uniref:DUF2470 domain-containing protein n=1 Tax=Corynebacterium hindlerae TaxID=699041 RepID=A0A7G5FCK2_9CORY|nr:hypothetical protein [Corynebacterium hindlerae]QMV84343.1 hypothetical protein HW450_08150 [Corynebacterium hindlerae]QTH59777.1 hypothetical protein J5O04_01105 [Corynebacterium hindlerae]